MRTVDDIMGMCYRNLVTVLGDEEQVSAKDITQECRRIDPDYSEGAFRPQDYSYNGTSKSKTKPRLYFLRVARGMYKLVGPSYKLY